MVADEEAVQVQRWWWNVWMAHPPTQDSSWHPASDAGRARRCVTRAMPVVRAGGAQADFVLSLPRIHSPADAG
jgi:hypothetical protein